MNTTQQKAELYAKDELRFMLWGEDNPLYTRSQLKQAYLAGHAAAVEEYKELNGWVKVTPDTLPPYYTPVLCVSEKGIRFIAWLATDGGEHYWTLSESDDLAPDPVGWQPLPPSPEKEQQ
jgi:hypothetical protein